MKRVVHKRDLDTSNALCKYEFMMNQKTYTHEKDIHDLPNKTKRKGHTMYVLLYGGSCMSYMIYICFILQIMYDIHDLPYKREKRTYNVCPFIWQIMYVIHDLPYKTNIDHV